MWLVKDFDLCGNSQGLRASTHTLSKLIVLKVIEESTESERR